MRGIDLGLEPGAGEGIDEDPYTFRQLLPDVIVPLDEAGGQLRGGLQGSDLWTASLETGRISTVTIPDGVVIPLTTLDGLLAIGCPGASGVGRRGATALALRAGAANEGVVDLARGLWRSRLRSPHVFAPDGPPALPPGETPAGLAQLEAGAASTPVQHSRVRCRWGRGWRWRCPASC